METNSLTILDGVSWVTVVLALVACLAFYIYIQWLYMPPGPTGLPYLGYYPFLRDDYHVQLHDMVKKYGDVFCFRSMGQLFVYLDNIQAVKEAHVKKSDCFAGRSMNFSLLLDTFGGGLTFENGEKWKTLRKFFIQKFKEFGWGNKRQESLMDDCLKKTKSAIRKASGENFNVGVHFNELCSQFIGQLILSGTEINDSDIKEFSEAYFIVQASMFGRNFVLAGPLLKYILVPFTPHFRKYRKCKLRAEAILKKIVAEHEKTFDKDNIRDVVDCFINERKNLKEKRDPKADTFSERGLVNTLIQIIGDGGVSVGLVVALVLKQLCVFPEVQKKIQHEIDEVVGHSRSPSWDDRSKMPYTNATILECFRKSDFFPIMPSLECTKETTVGDCRVPKGAITLVNFWSAARDPEAYKEPEKFDPTRFLPSGDQKSKLETHIFFGVGKRMCIGESLVLMETFVFLSTILQNYDLHPPKDDTDESADKKEAYSEFDVMIRVTPRSL